MLKWCFVGIASMQGVNPGYHGQKRFFTNLLLSYLAIPQLMGDTNLPLLVTEEDTIWAPHAGLRLEKVRLQTTPHGRGCMSTPAWLLLHDHLGMGTRAWAPLRSAVVPCCTITCNK